ncbi:hypothetical protein N9C80_06060, partial [Paracoccaceae bacterium]|nr:hypothetical protein [Paracoccaceae bacterium]
VFSALECFLHMRGCSFLVFAIPAVSGLYKNIISNIFSGFFKKQCVGCALLWGVSLSPLHSALSGH